MLRALTLVALGVVWIALPANIAAAPAVKSGQELATLRFSHEVFAKPALDATPLELVRSRRPITEERTVLPVVAHRVAHGLRWLRVLLPGRPNGHTGWITERATTVSTTPWRLEINTARREVVVYRSGRRTRVFSAVVGKPSTPTPYGEFFVEEDVQLGAADVGAPFALALSARSNVLQEFEGGPGQIAVHGLANVGGVLGTAVSHGCIRLDAAAMRWLVEHIGPGTPVSIR
ncbi:MAG: L,D-transpeptidase [Gaiellaceae bacterium]